MRPKVLRQAAMAMRAANQVRVSQAGPSARHSFQVSTPETSRMVRPTSAAATEEMPSEPPVTHSATVSSSAPPMIFSSRLMGPSLASSSFALAGAPGESLISGG